MPYIQRNFVGKIVGVFTNPQKPQEGSCLSETEWVEEDYPELVEFRKDRPTFIPLETSEEERRRADADNMCADEEYKEVQLAVLHHIQAWTELETALSALLYVALNIQPASSKIAYAIYHGLTGFDARLTVVHNVIAQLIYENNELELLRPFWEQLAEKVKKAKNLRNTIAHSTIQKINYGSPPRESPCSIKPAAL